MSQDETLETSCKLLARKRLLIPRANMLLIAYKLNSVNYPAVCNKITVQEENEHRSNDGQQGLELITAQFEDTITVNLK